MRDESAIQYHPEHSLVILSVPACHPEHSLVILSEAKDLARWATRSFANAQDDTQERSIPAVFSPIPALIPPLGTLDYCCDYFYFAEKLCILFLGEPKLHLRPSTFDFSL